MNQSRAEVDEQDRVPDEADHAVLAQPVAGKFTHLMLRTISSVHDQVHRLTFSL